MLFWSVFLIAEMFQVYETYLFFRCFFKKCRLVWWGELLCYIGLLAFKTIPYLVSGTPIVTMLCTYIGGILLAGIYQGSWKKKIACGTFTYILFALAECALAIVTGFVHKDLFLSEYYFSLFGIVCLPIMGFLLVLLVRNIKRKREGEDVSLSYWFVSVMLPVLSMLLFFLFYQQKELQSATLFLCICILFVLNIFVFYMFDHQMEAMRVIQEKEILELQNGFQMKQLETMNQVLGEARAQNHEFERHISMVSYFNEKGEQARLQDYLEEIRESRRLYQWVDSGNIILDGILNLKVQQARQAQIAADIEVKIPDSLKLSAYDMNVLLGNFIDNAIEAQEKLEPEERFLRVSIRYQNPRLSIRICNPYSEVHIDEKGNLKTHKRDKENHGYGLRNARGIVEKYAGDMQIQREEGVFEVFAYLVLEQYAD